MWSRTPQRFYMYMIPHFENISRKNLNFLKPMSLFLKLINLLLGSSESTFVLAIFIGNKVGRVFELVWQVVLLDPVAGVVVGIFIVLCISQFLTSSIMTIAEVARNGSTTGFLQCFTATRSRLLYILQMEELRVWIPLMVMKYFFRRLRLWCLLPLL